MTQIEPRLVPVKEGWAAVGDGWAVVGATRDEARKRFSAAEKKHAELRARHSRPSDRSPASTADLPTSVR
jgi:hypothetical protein